MTDSQLAGILRSQFNLLWALNPVERNRRIEEIRADYEYERLLDRVAYEMTTEPPAEEPIQPEPGTLLQFVAAIMFVGCCIGALIIATTPGVPV